MHVVGTPAYFAATGVPQAPTDLPAAIIYAQRLGGATWTFRQGTAEISVTVGGWVHVAAAEGVREGVLASLGFAVASEWMFAPELKSGVVVCLLDDWSLPAVDLWAVFPTGRQASAKARAFAAFVERQISGWEESKHSYAIANPLVPLERQFDRDADLRGMGDHYEDGSRCVIGRRRGRGLPALRMTRRRADRSDWRGD